MGGWAVAQSTILVTTKVAHILMNRFVREPYVQGVKGSPRQLINGGAVYSIVVR